MCQHIGDETKCGVFCRRHLQIIFLVWHLLYLNSNITEICSHLPIKPGLVQTMAWCQTADKPNISTNDGIVNWRMYASHCLDLNSARQLPRICYKLLTVSELSTSTELLFHQWTAIQIIHSGFLSRYNVFFTLLPITWLFPKTFYH